MPQVTILQAVALSLDIEPNQIRFRREGWMSGPSDRPLLDESQEFEDRLTVVLGNATPLTTNRPLTSQTRVAINAFVGLATAFEWTMPAELRKLKDKASTMALSNARSCNEWPAHTTKKLEALKAAAREWWSTYDANDPSTAPTTNEVRDWVHKEHGVPITSAAEIASILRPDNLKSGPRRTGNRARRK